MTDNSVRKIQPLPSPPQLLQQALEHGASIDVIDKLLTAQERWEGMQAKKAFSNAIADFKAGERPQILKNIEVSFGGNKAYKHEDLADLLAAVDPALARHGLWVRFKIHSAPDLVTVTCVLGHRDGYSVDDNSLSDKPDTSGSKNHIQAIGSTVSYLQRYTLKAALGLAAAKDDDGRGSGDRISNNEPSYVKKFDEIQSLLKNFGDKAVEKFLHTAGALTINDIEPVKYDSCINYLNRQLEAARAKKR